MNFELTRRLLVFPGCPTGIGLANGAFNGWEVNVQEFVFVLALNGNSPGHDRIHAHVFLSHKLQMADRTIVASLLNSQHGSSHAHWVDGRPLCGGRVPLDFSKQIGFDAWMWRLLEHSVLKIMRTRA